MAGAADRVKILRARRGVEDSPTVLVGNHLIAVAMQDQERDFDLSDFFQIVVTSLEQRSNWQ